MIYVVLQSLIIIGIRAAAKGGTEILPDGSEKDSEMILYPLLKFLTRTIPNKIYYEGKEFEKLMDKINRLSKLELLYDDSKIKNTNKSGNINSFINDLQVIINQVDSNIKIELSNNFVRLYKIDAKYKISKYFRKPIIQCPICMSSFWSIFSYWIPTIYLFDFSIELVYLGGINICAVACLNWLIWTRGHANEAVAKG